MLSARKIVITPAKGADGRTLIRLDAEVVWYPSRPADEHIPASATVLTVTAANTMNPTLVSLPKPVTVRVTLTFRATSTGPIVAELVATDGGCGDLAVTIGGKKLPTLCGRDDFVARLYQTLGVAWDPRP